MSEIRVENLFKSFHDFVAVDGVSFRVRKGELVALLGPSGSGKSTILRIIAGLESPERGQVFLTGREVTGLRVQKRRVGFVFQHYALFRHMTVAKNIAFGMEIQKRPKREIQLRVGELIDLVKLNGHEQHYPAQLSGGQRQRVALARALAPEPRVLLLDEPFGALDAKVRNNLAQWLRSLHDRLHVTSIFVTHDQSEAMEIADKLVVINHGRVEQIGPPGEVYANPASRFVASFVGPVNILEAFAGDGCLRIKGLSRKFTWEKGAHGPVRPVLLLVRPEDIRIGGPGDSPMLPARVAGIRYRGSHHELELNLGQNRIKCMVPRNDAPGRVLKSMGNVPVSLSSFVIFPASEGHHSLRRMLTQIGYIE